MGSKSSSQASTKTETNNLALDQSSTVRDGLQILDSIIVDPSDKVMVKTIEQHKAAFEVLTTQGTIQLAEMLTLGSELLRLTDAQQIRMAAAQYHMLETGVRMLEEEMKLGKYVVDLVDLSANRTFDLAEKVHETSSDGLSQALALVGDVKSDTTSEMVKSVSTLMVVFGLGALYLTTRNT